MPKLVLASVLAVSVQSLGCGQFFVASSVKVSPDGSTHVFSTKDARVCQVAETGEPICTQVATH